MPAACRRARCKPPAAGLWCRCWRRRNCPPCANIWAVFLAFTPSARCSAPPRNCQPSNAPLCAFCRKACQTAANLRWKAAGQTKASLCFRRKSARLWPATSLTKPAPTARFTAPKCATRSIFCRWRCAMKPPMYIAAAGPAPKVCRWAPAAGRW